MNSLNFVMENIGQQQELEQAVDEQLRSPLLDISEVSSVSVQEHEDKYEDQIAITVEYTLQDRKELNVREDIQDTVHKHIEDGGLL